MPGAAVHRAPLGLGVRRPVESNVRVSLRPRADVPLLQSRPGRLLRRSTRRAPAAVGLVSAAGGRRAARPRDGPAPALEGDAAAEGLVDGAAVPGDGAPAGVPPARRDRRVVARGSPARDAALLPQPRLLRYRRLRRRLHHPPATTLLHRIPAEAQAPWVSRRRRARI